MGERLVMGYRSLQLRRTMQQERTEEHMQTDAELTIFLDAVRTSLADGTFLKIALGKYRGAGEERKCAAARVDLKGVPHVRFVARRGKHDITENATLDGTISKLAQLVGTDYLSAVLFTSREDISLVYSKKRAGRLTRSKPAFTDAPSTEHNRQKTYLVDPQAAYLAHLGVTHAGGQVKASMYGKYRQICRFVEILDQLLAASELRDAPALTVADIGSGKGYLTFALHEHLARRLGKTPATRGIEANAGLVDASNAIVAQCKMTGLTFEAATAGTQEPHALDILIALHACDTATDDAIALGIKSDAAVIVCAPCCQHEIAPQLDTRGSALAGLLKYGLLKQRQADLITDAARALLLEANGYDVRIIEFISDEHTSKNLMIAAVRSDNADRKAAARQYDQLADFSGFKHHRLKDVLTAAS
jgi:Methyltransferase domain